MRRADLGGIPGTLVNAAAGSHSAGKVGGRQDEIELGTASAAAWEAAAGLCRPLFVFALDISAEICSAAMMAVPAA